MTLSEDIVTMWGDDGSIARECANCEGTLGKDQWDETTTSVGSFRPNGYGLYDMAGNVWEWCQDWSDEDKKYRGGPLEEPERLFRCKYSLESCQ